MQEQYQGTPITTFESTGGGGGGHFPLGEYEGDFIGAENMGKGKFNPDVDRVRLMFKINKVLQIDTYPDDVAEGGEEDFEDSLVGKEYHVYCNYLTGPKADLSRYISWMAGSVQVGAMDIAPLLNKPYRITIGEVVKQKPDGGTVTKVEPTGIRAIKQQRSRRSNKPVESEDDDELF